MRRLLVATPALGLLTWAVYALAVNWPAENQQDWYDTFMGCVNNFAPACVVNNVQCSNCITLGSETAAADGDVDLGNNKLTSVDEMVGESNEQMIIRSLEDAAAGAIAFQMLADTNLSLNSSTLFRIAENVLGATTATAGSSLYKISSDGTTLTHEWGSGTRGTAEYLAKAGGSVIKFRLVSGGNETYLEDDASTTATLATGQGELLFIVNGDTNPECGNGDCLLFKYGVTRDTIRPAETLLKDWNIGSSTQPFYDFYLADFLRAGSGKKIGIQVDDASYTVGSLGSLIAPVDTVSGSPTDTEFGNKDGALAVNSADDALYFRSGTAWKQVPTVPVSADNGGTGKDSSTWEGVPYIAATGDWLYEEFLSPVRGGTGIDTSNVTGVPTISTGTWSIKNLLPASFGGTGQNGFTDTCYLRGWSDPDVLTETCPQASGTVLRSNGTFAEFSQLGHSELSGLTSGDDHTQYALLAGRSGGQELKGGTAAGDDLTLNANSSTTDETGKILLDDSMEVLTRTLTFPSAGVVGIRHNPTVNGINASNPTVQAFDIKPVYTYTVAQSHGFAVKAGMSFFPKWAADSSLGSGSDQINAIGIYLRPKIDATGDGSGRTVTQNIGMLCQPETTGSAGTLTTAEGFKMQAIIASGTTMTNLRGVHIDPPTTGGSVTNWEALLIEDTSKPSTLNVGIRQQGTNAHNRLQGDTMIGADSTPSAKLHVQVPSTGTEVMRLESVASGTPDPAEHVVQGRASVSSTSYAVLTSISTTSNRGYHVRAFFTGHCTSGASCSGGISNAVGGSEQIAMIRNDGGSLSTGGSSTIYDIGYVGTTGLCFIGTSGTSIQFKCKGNTGSTIIWHVTVKWYEVGT